MPTMAPPVTATIRSRTSFFRPQRSAACPGSGLAAFLADAVACDMSTIMPCGESRRAPSAFGWARRARTVASTRARPTFLSRLASGGVAFPTKRLLFLARQTGTALARAGRVKTDSDERDENVWNPNRLTLGIEEEFHLVDLSTRRITPRASDVLGQLTNRAP